MRKGQSDETLLIQAKQIGQNYDAISVLLKSFIANIDSLDTKKHSLGEAWKMVDFQINRKLQRLAEEAQKKSE